MSSRPASSAASGARWLDRSFSRSSAVAPVRGEEREAREQGRARHREHEDAQRHLAAVGLHAEAQERDEREDQQGAFAVCVGAAAPPAPAGEGHDAAGQHDARVEDQLVGRTAALDTAGDGRRDIAADAADPAEEVVEVPGPVRLGHEAEPDRDEHGEQDGQAAEFGAADQDEDREHAQHHERRELVGRDARREKAGQHQEQDGLLTPVGRFDLRLAGPHPGPQDVRCPEPDQQDRDEGQVEQEGEALRGEVVLADPAAEYEDPDAGPLRPPARPQ